MLIRFSGLIGLAAVCAAHAGAQAPPSEAQVEVFEPAYFARFNPSTAEDMVRQLPGFAIDEGEQVRGFGGAAGNVLVNGARPASKERIGTLLARIPAANILRIEIVSGASAKLDMRGQTKVANVILKAAELNITGNWQVQARHYSGGRITADAEASATLPAFDGTLTLSLKAGAVGSSGRSGGPSSSPRGETRRDSFNGSGALFEQQSGIFLNTREAVEPAFEFKRSMDWGKLNLNGSYSTSDNAGSTFVEVYTPSFTGALSRLEATNSSFARDGFDLNGDVSFALAGGEAKLIALHRRSETASDFLYDYYNGLGAFTRSTRVTSDESQGESIVRGQISWPIGSDHTVEVSLEGAYNFLDSTRRVTLNTGADVTPPGSDTIVEELRGEAQISDIWRVSPELTIEPSLRFEYSQIKQEGRLSSTSSVFAEREFTYPKPGVTATWRPNPTQQLRLSLRRDVAQLNFSDFVSSVEVINDQVTAGNAGLEPQKVWTLDTQFEQKFWGDGVLTLIATYEQVSDVQDQAPVIPLGASLLQAFDGPGNIGEGEKLTLGFRAAVPLKNVGVPGGRLDLQLTNGDSEVIDPVTGATRAFSDDFNRFWRVAFRQDLPDLGFSYGFSFGGSGGATSYRLKETFKRVRTEGDLSIFVETRKLFGLNVRAGFNDIFEPAFKGDRIVYNAPRSTGAVTLRQKSESRGGPWGFIRIAGTF
jgi:hypothetical protein